MKKITNHILTIDNGDFNKLIEKVFDNLRQGINYMYNILWLTNRTKIT